MLFAAFLSLPIGVYLGKAIPHHFIFVVSFQEPIESDFEPAEIYNSNIGHNLSSLHLFLSDKLDLLSQVRANSFKF